ncbi:MAG: hypothetical protein GY820_38245 [Gammaproteobacteria bacterium]|nr:hypothetical protein [Gammaproteobacteria bacterium]
MGSRERKERQRQHKDARDCGTEEPPVAEGGDGQDDPPPILPRGGDGQDDPPKQPN